jgi:hypothetical protein
MLEYKMRRNKIFKAIILLKGHPFIMEDKILHIIE